MAIIRHEGALDRLPQTLLSILVQKQELELAKEDQKIRQADLKIRQEEAEREKELEQAQIAGAQGVLQLLPEAIQAAAAGLDPSALPAFIAGQGAVRAQEAEIGLTEARRVDLGTMAAHRDRLAAIDEERNRLTESGQTLQNSAALRGLELEARGLRQRFEAGRQQLASDEVTRMMQIFASTGRDPLLGLQAVYGTPDRNLAVQSILGDDVLSPERLVTAMLTGYEIPAEVQNRIKQGLFTEDLEPQALLDQLFSTEDIDPEFKARIFASLRALDPSVTVPAGAEAGDSTIRALFRLRVNPFPTLPAPQLTPSAPGSRTGSNAFRG